MLKLPHPGDSLTALLSTYKPDVIALEAVETVQTRTRRLKDGRIVVGVIPDQALGLYKTGRMTERLVCAAEAAGVEVIEFSAELWRTALIGIPNPDETRIETTLRGRLLGFPPPRGSNAHHRDALGVARFGLLRWLAEQRKAS